MQLKKVKADLKQRVVYRFCDISKESSSIKKLLDSIFNDIGISVPSLTDNIKNGNSLEKKNKFDAEKVKNAFNSINENIIIYIDSIDSLNDGESTFEWLPEQLKDNVKIVISVDDDTPLKQKVTYYELLKKRYSNLYQIKPLDKKDIAKAILLNILSKENRKLQEMQIDYILGKYKEINIPLYLKIISHEARLYKSDLSEIPLELADTMQGAFDEFISNLSEFYHHNGDLVAKVFGYLYASKFSLNEAILFEVLSKDKEILENVENKYEDKEIRSLPSSIWARLHYQLKPFLVYDRYENIQFLHREFKEKAKSIYKDSFEISQTFLKIIEDIIDTSENEKEKMYCEIYILSVKNQIKYFPHEAEEYIQKYIQFLSTKSSCNIGSILFDLGDYYYDLACYSTAINFYKKVVEMQYIDSDLAAVLLGICYMNIDDEDNAIVFYELARKLNSSLSDDKLLFDLGLAYTYTNNYEKAIETFQEAANFNSSNPKPLYYLSMIYTNMKNYLKAKKYILNAIEIDNACSEYFYTLGQIYSAQNMYTEAITAYKKTIELFPESSDAMCNLSDAYNRLHDYEAAIFYAKKSVELNANDFYSYANLGESYEKLGQIALGIDSYSSALKINPEFEGAQNGLERLLELKKS